LSKIKIEYDGAYPNLCSGELIITIDGIRWVFPKFCLSSGGSCGFTNNYEDSYIEQGLWSIEEWPQGFPEDLKDEVLDEVNDEVPHGCCGGCL